ncbi:MAG: hypothetical protein PSX80_05670 [bacterium]|nr:hypothetical protein [bacterium]
MLRKYENEEEIYELLTSFETGTIARDKWKHAEHLVVALCYLREAPLDAATAKMREGIFNLLKAFGVDLEKEMPYHETLTVFWMRTAYAYILMNENLSFVEKANGLCELYDKDHPLTYYSRELLFSDRARAEYVEPDLEKCPDFPLPSFHETAQTTRI